MQVIAAGHIAAADEQDLEFGINHIMSQLSAVPRATDCFTVLPNT
jgi:hypothetical protein